MYRSILVPVDGSPAAERAVEYARTLARGSGGRLILVQAIHASPLPGFDAAEAQIEGVRTAGLWLSDHVAKLRDDGLQAEQHVYCGEPGAIILRAIHDLQADVIIMSTHGHSGLPRVVYGNVANHVLRHAEVPVLLIPLNCELSWREAPTQAIVLPLDGSELAEEALPPAVELAGALDARITLLQVVQPFKPPSAGERVMPFDPDVAISTAGHYLATIEGRPVAAGMAVEKLALVGQPAATICAEAERERAAAIVMATHGRSGTARLVLGSVATSVLQACRRPSLLVCPKAISRHESRVASTAAP